MADLLFECVNNKLEDLGQATEVGNEAVEDDELDSICKPIIKELASLDKILDPRTSPLSQCGNNPSDIVEFARNRGCPLDTDALLGNRLFLIDFLVSELQTHRIRAHIQLGGAQGGHISNVANICETLRADTKPGIDSAALGTPTDRLDAANKQAQAALSKLPSGYMQVLCQ